MMTCPYCGPVEPKTVLYSIKKPEAGSLTIDWCPKCTACLKPDALAALSPSQREATK